MSKTIMPSEDISKTVEVADVLNQFSVDEQQDMLFYMQAFSQGMRYGMSKVITTQSEPEPKRSA